MFIKALKILACLVIILTLYIYLQFFSGYVFPWDKPEAIQTITEWGGLTPLPAKMEETDIEKKGAPFTRQFTIEFTASQEQIESWIRNSKRLKNNIPKQKGLKKIYDIPSWGSRFLWRRCRNRR